MCWVGGNEKGGDTEVHTRLRGRRNEIKRGNRTWFSLKNFPLSSVETRPKKCGNPPLEFMLWKQGGRRGITAFSLSLRDHNDDKESITVLYRRYVHSWGDSQSAGCQGLPLHSLPLLGKSWGGAALCQLLEETTVDCSSVSKRASERGTVDETTVCKISRRPRPWDKY